MGIRIGAGGALKDLVYGDTNSDEWADFSYDVGTAIANEFELASGESVLYVTTTLFGTIAPDLALRGCEEVIGGDGDGDGVSDDRIKRKRNMIRTHHLVFISWLAAITLPPLSAESLAQATPTAAGAVELAEDEVLVMFVMPLRDSSSPYTLCLDDAAVHRVLSKSHVSTVTAGGRHLLWCDARAQWLELKPGRRYALVMAEQPPDPPSGGGITFRGWEEGPEWFLEDYDVGKELVSQLELEEHEGDWEVVPPKVYKKRYEKMQKRTPEFALPADFTKVLYRDGEELREVDPETRFRREAKGWGKRGLPRGILRIDAQTVEFKSESVTATIAISEIRGFHFANLAGSEAWLSIQYGEAGQTRTAYLGADAEDFNRVFMALIEAAETRAQPAREAGSEGTQ